MLVVLGLMGPLVANGVVWALPLGALAHGEHRVTLHAVAGHVAVTMAHTESDHDHHDHDHDATPSHANPHHTDHVVALSAPAASCTLPAPPLPRDGGPAVIVAASATFALVRIAPLSCRPHTRIGPPLPSRSNILRI